MLYRYFILFFLLSTTFKCFATFERVNEEEVFCCKAGPSLTFFIERVTAKNASSWQSFIEEIKTYNNLQNEVSASKIPSTAAPELANIFYAYAQLDVENKPEAEKKAWHQNTFERAALAKSENQFNQMERRRQKFKENPNSDPEMLQIHRYNQVLPVFSSCLSGGALQDESIEPPNSVWVAYAAQTENLSDIEGQKDKYIELAVTVTTNAETPLVTFMGAFRNPLINRNNPHLSATLYGFAAQAISRIFHDKHFMFTFLRKNMEEVLLTSFQAKGISMKDSYSQAEIYDSPRGYNIKAASEQVCLLNEFFPYYHAPWKRVERGVISVFRLSTLSKLGLDSLNSSPEKWTDLFIRTIVIARSTIKTGLASFFSKMKRLVWGTDNTTAY